jgi:hypothetical protein
MHFIQRSMQEEQSSVLADRHEIEQMLVRINGQWTMDN